MAASAAVQLACKQVAAAVWKAVLVQTQLKSVLNRSSCEYIYTADGVGTKHLQGRATVSLSGLSDATEDARVNTGGGDGAAALCGDSDCSSSKDGELNVEEHVVLYVGRARD